VARPQPEHRARRRNGTPFLPPHLRSLPSVSAATKEALLDQIRYQQAAAERERREDREWLKKEQDRIAIWNQEERNKIEETKLKNETIRKQREQQLRELDAVRKREQMELEKYDQGTLRTIKKEIQLEKAKEAMKRASDAENLRLVAEQNVRDNEMRKVQQQQEFEAMRKLESQWAEVLNKQERARERQLKQTYSRQALQYGTAATMQEVLAKIAAEDEARAERHAKELEDKAAQRERDQKNERARLQAEMLDVLGIQVREKRARAKAEASREQMVLEREERDNAVAEKADTRKKEAMRMRNETYKHELLAQMRVQEERKVLEPYLMSLAERQMNAALLRKLPSSNM
jgi:colicin import membrane protein